MDTENDLASKVHGIHFSDLPIYSASFIEDDVIVSGRRPFYYIYDAVAGVTQKCSLLQREEKSLEKFVSCTKYICFLGNDGYLLVVDKQHRLLIKSLKINGSVRAVAFSTDEDYLVASGSDGDVYTFDTRTWRCVSRFQNEDGTITSSISMSEDFMAVGAESGVVNLYNNYTDASGGRRKVVNKKPLKSIMNLMTSADMVKFNADGAVLGLSTRRQQDSFKLYHTASGAVFSNWPTSKTPLGYVFSFDFSANNKYLAIGNDKGKCLLYKLKHYAHRMQFD